MIERVDLLVPGLIAIAMSIQLQFIEMYLLTRFWEPAYRLSLPALRYRCPWAYGELTPSTNIYSTAQGSYRVVSNSTILFYQARLPEFFDRPKGNVFAAHGMITLEEETAMVSIKARYGPIIFTTLVVGAVVVATSEVPILAAFIATVWLAMMTWAAHGALVEVKLLIAEVIDSQATQVLPKNID